MLGVTSERHWIVSSRSDRVRWGVALLSLSSVCALVMVAGLVFAPIPEAAEPGAEVAADADADNASVIELTAIAATWTSEREPSTSQGDSSTLTVDGESTSAWLTFDTSELAGLSIASAELELSVNDVDRAGDLNAFHASTVWDPLTLTHDNQPDHRSELLGTGPLPVHGGGDLRVPLALSTELTTTYILGIELRAAKNASAVFDGEGEFAPRLIISLKREARVAVSAPGQSAQGQSPAEHTPHTGMVFAHYFPPFPISIDNEPPDHDYYAEEYLTPDGENGKHSTYGGLLRDRPLPRQPRDGDWRLADLRMEIRQAKAAGIDGFTVNLMSLSGRNWDASMALMSAAKSEGDFVIIPNVDATSSFVDAPTASIVDKLVELYSSGPAYRTAEGAFALSSFKAEAESPAWWGSLTDALEDRLSTPVAFMAVLLNASDENMTAYAPVSYALGDWGARTPSDVRGAPHHATKAHALGVKWMAPVAPQDARPRVSLYAESNNTELLRTMWDRAIDDGADFVQLVTWNDYSESTQFAPSVAHGAAFLDVSRPYIAEFTTGVSARFADDTVVVTYRTQYAGADAQYPQQPMSPTLGGATTPPRDLVEVVTMMRADTHVTVTIGESTYTYLAERGLVVTTFPLAAGAIAVTAERGATVLADLEPPQSVSATPKVLDLQYHAVSNA